MFGWLRSLVGLGSGASASAPVPVRARYDNALTTPENIRHWGGADWLSAKAANSFQVRRQLRIRSRHEVANNPFLFGIVHSNADDLIDTGPTLQVYSGDTAYDRAVEGMWNEWCAEVDLVEKLRTSKLAKSVDGEGFLVLKTVEDLEQPVKLYPCDIEADQVTTPAPKDLGELWVDGLVLHPITGRPTHYTVLKHHPGDYYFPDFNPLAVERIQARHVVHWFQQTRPGQVRGVPVFTPSLDLFTELRAFRRAVLGAAEIAADYAAVMTQDRETGAYDPDDDTNQEYQPFARVPIHRKMLTTLPPGASMTQFDAKQPTTTYDMFQEKCLGEACRPLGYPLNLALGTSQKFNFSSAKLDHINYRNGLTIEREQCGKGPLERIFRAWFEEAVLCGAIPLSKGLTVPRHEWHWPGYEPIDPVSDAQADHERLSNGTDNWQRFWARRGLDWRDVMRQQAAEQKEIDRLGLQFGEPATKSITETTDMTDDGRPVPPNKAAAHRRLWQQYVRASALIEAVKDDNGQEHDDHGRFGEGGPGAEHHKEEAKRAHEQADQYAGHAKDAKENGDHDAARVHKKAERAHREVARVHEAIADAKDRHAAAVEQIQKDHADKVAHLDDKVREAHDRVREAKEKAAGGKERIEELKRKMAESKKRAKAAESESLRALKDDNGQQHDEKGRFGEGAGGDKSSKKDKHPAPSTDHTKPSEKTDSGHTGDGAKSLKERGKAIAEKIKKHGAKAIAVAKKVGVLAKRLAVEASMRAMSGNLADDICETSHDYSKIINAKGTGDWLSAEKERRLRAHLGVSGGFAATVASHVLSFGLTKLKTAIAARRERKAKEAAEKDSKASLYEPGMIRGSAAEGLAVRAKAVATILAAFYGAMGCPDDDLPVEADVLAWMKKQARTEAAHA